MTITAFFIFITALLLCMVLIPPLRLAADWLQIMDVPGERKVHHSPMPRIGGVAFGLAAFGSIMLWAPWDAMMFSVLVGALIILAFGVCDDRFRLNYKSKLVGQLIAAFVVVWIGLIRLDTVPFLFEHDAPPWVSIPLTILFIMGAANAFNLADGLDGLAGGLAFLSFAGIAYLAYLSNDWMILLSAVAFLGGLLGFLRYNTFPARIFMGDAGSQLLGFFMGVLVILLTDSSRNPFSPSVGLLILGLPFLDTIAVMGHRIVKGGSPFIGDRNHVHHKLLSIGFSHYEAVIVIYAIQGIMVGLAYLLRWQSDALTLTIYLGFAVSMFALFIATERHVYLQPASAGGRFLSNTKLAWNGAWISAMAPRYLAVVVPLFLVMNVFLPGHVPEDVGYAAIALFPLVLLGPLLFPQYASFFVRVGLYVGSAFLMYMSEQSSIPRTWSIEITQNTFLAIIAILVVLCIRYSRTSRFQTTPLDYLMVFFALVIPLMPEVRTDMPTVSALAGKLIVLYFSFELLLHIFADRLKQLRLVSLWILLGLGVRAWL